MNSPARMGIVTQSIAAFGVICSLPSVCAADSLSHAKVDDSNAINYSVSVIVIPDEWRSSSGLRGQGGVELSYEHQAGNAIQQLYDGQYIQYGSDGNFHGVQQVSHQASVDHIHIAYERLFSFGGNFQLEPSLGIATDKVNVRTAGASTLLAPLLINVVSLRQDLYGVALGVTLRWNFNKFLAVEVPVDYRIEFGSVGNVLNLFSDHYVGTTLIVSPSLAFCPGKNISLVAGYAYRQQNIETHRDQSNIDLGFGGANVSIRVRF
ncbi:MAG TPA: hypothetical protein VG962_09090 [Steroidobacteraceae bacterium]|nr:hypothetical protein [Steroidobacteraceae bacterium]